MKVDGTLAEVRVLNEFVQNLQCRGEDGRMQSSREKIKQSIGRGQPAGGKRRCKLEINRRAANAACLIMTVIAQTGMLMFRRMTWVERRKRRKTGIVFKGMTTEISTAVAIMISFFPT